MKEKIKKWVDETIATLTAYDALLSASNELGFRLCERPIKKIQLYKGITFLAENLGQTIVRAYHSNEMDEVYFYFNDFKFFQLVERGVENV